MAEQYSGGEERKAHLYDQSVKQFLSNKQLLAQILKGCVEEFKQCDVNDIAQRYIEGVPKPDRIPYLPNETNAKLALVPLADGNDVVGFANDKTIEGEGRRTFDICFFATAPKEDELIRIIINIEAQKDYPKKYSLQKRAIYYGSRLISAQYDVEFKHSDFNNIRKVYSIWICANPHPDWQNTITRYHLNEENIKGNAHADVDDYDLLNIIVLGLGPDNGDGEKDLLYLLRAALVEKQNKESLMKVLKEFGMHDDPELEKEAENMCNLSQGVLEVGRAEGRAEGLAEGLAAGMDLFGILVQKLLAEKRYADMDRAAGDTLYRDQLMKEYGITPA